MENLPFNSENNNEKPDNTGELDTPKRKRRKTRIPKKLIETAEEKPKSKEKPQEKKPEEKPAVAEAETEAVQSNSEPERQEEALVLPEVEEAEPEYEGELIVDHSGEKDPDLVYEKLPSEEKLDADTEAAQPATQFESVLENEADEQSPAETIQETAQESLVPETAPAELAPDMAAAETFPDPPTVAPPLPFMFGSFGIPQAEIERPITPEPEPETTGAPDTSGSRLRGRLSEEWANVRSRTEQTDSSSAEADANRRAYYAEKRGLSRGVVTGGLVGYLLGRRGKSKLERETKAALDGRDRTIKKLNNERISAEQDTAKHLNLIKRTQHEVGEALRRTREQLNKKQAEAAPVIQATRVVERMASPTAFEMHSSMPETDMPLPAAEARPETPKPEVMPENMPITEETYMVPEGRRVEASVWHRIEVDEKTGQAVEKPSFEYGEAFKREQNVEKLAAGPSKAQTAAQVGMTLLYGGTEPTSTPLVSPSVQASPRRQEATTLKIRREAAYASRQIVRHMTQPFTWVLGLVIVVLLFLVGAIR